MSLQAQDECAANGAYLADVADEAEENWIKGILNAINPQDGTDYYLGGQDLDDGQGMHWLSGMEMNYNDFVDGEPAGRYYLHMDYDLGFRWNTKNDDDQVRFFGFYVQNNNLSFFAFHNFFLGQRVCLQEDCLEETKLHHFRLNPTKRSF